jgi:hypothetical protein
MNHQNLLSGLIAFIIAMTVEGSLGASSDSDSSYFPLQIGRQWVYDDYLTKTIIDTVTINGHLYYTKKTAFGSSSYLERFRASNDTIYVLNLSIDTLERPLYLLGTKIGDSASLGPNYGCSYGNFVVMEGRTDSITVPTGTYLHSYHYTHYGLCFDGGMMDSWLAKGVGVTKSTSQTIAGPISSVLTSTALLNYSSDYRKTPALGNYSLFTKFDPFRNRITLSFQLPSSGFVRISVFDLLGNNVRQLDDEWKPAGDYHLFLANPAARGNTYILVLQTNAGCVTKRICLP